MPYLLRVELPDVPGSLGRVASAIGEAGGDIEAIEIVEHRPDDGTAVDDVLLEIAQGTMPDSIVSACNLLDGVHVLWISRYAAGGNLFLDLEAVEELTVSPVQALDRLIELLPRPSGPTGPLACGVRRTAPRSCTAAKPRPTRSRGTRPTAASR
ncbi:ACT domain-containing protein [Nocardioides alcanivorans]|uniref:ACT domain-containing protein n=1 Tax=Nocardioides alcanivorans TaxID=2897352 RepID=UPI0035DDAF22